MNKKLLCQLVYDLEQAGKHQESEEVQNLMDLCEMLIDSIHKIEEIKKIVGIQNDID